MRESRGRMEARSMIHHGTEQEAVDLLVAAQKLAGDPIDPAGARRFIRALVALGLIRFASHDS